MGKFDAWDEALAEDDPDPLAIIRLAGMYTRYLNAVVDEASTVTMKRGVSLDEVSDAFHGNTMPVPFPWKQFGAFL